MTKMPIHLLIGSMLALVFMTTCPEQTLAQNAQPDKPTQPGKPSKPGDIFESRRIDVDFPGGTLAEYVEVVRRASPKRAANIVVVPGARELPVSPVKLVAVNVEIAIQLLEGRYVLPNGQRVKVGVETFPIINSTHLVFKIDASTDYVQIKSAVWNITDALIGGRTDKELLGAVEAALSLFPQKADITFHPPTGLLIIRGTGEQLKLVREAIEQMIEGAERQRERADELREQIDALEEELHQTMAMQKLGEQQIGVAKTRVSEVADALEKEKALPSDLAEAELEVTRAQTELSMQNDRYRRIMKRLVRLQESLARIEKPRE